MAPYNGPTVREMVASHTLAQETMARHGTGDQAIFDDDNINQLRRFVQDPSSERSVVFGKLGMGSGDDSNDVQAAIDKAGGGGHSLAEYAVVAHGTDKAVLTDEEIVALREWFASGGGQPQD